MRHFVLLLAAAALAGCASYVVPGGPARLDAINRADIAEVASRQPAATIPAVMGIVRVQAPAYRSYTYMRESPGTGSFEVLTTQELLTDVQLQGMARWPGVAAARTGYTYGVAEATVRSSGLTSMWGTNEMVERKRLEAEQAAFDQLMVEAARTWVRSRRGCGSCLRGS